MAATSSACNSEKAYELLLHPGHMLNGFGTTNKLMPLSASSVEQEMDNIALPLSQPLKSSHGSYRGRLVGHTLLIASPSDPSQIELELEVRMSQVTGRIGAADRLACVSLLESHDRSSHWLFIIHGGPSALSRVVSELMRQGAVLADLMELPRRLLRLCPADEQVFVVRSSDVVPFSDGYEEELPLPDGSDHSSDSLISAHGEQSPSLQESSSSRSSSKASPEEQKDDGCSPRIDTARSMTFSSADFSTALLVEPVLPIGSEEAVGRVLKFYKASFSTTAGSTSPCMLSLSGANSPSFAGALGKISLELKILTQVQDHRHIVKSFGVMLMQDPVGATPSYALQMEYCHGGALRRYTQENGPMSEQTAACMMKGLLSALMLLHSKDIVHRNVNRDHIVLRKSTGDWLLCGFGSAHQGCSPSQGEADSRVGTTGYLSPETIEQRYYSPATDIFAAGVVLYLACMNKYPFGSPNRQQMTDRRTLAGTFDFEEKVECLRTEGYKDFIRCLLEPNYKTRPSALEALCNSWFRTCGVDTGAGNDTVDATDTSTMRRRSFLRMWKTPALPWTKTSSHHSSVNACSRYQTQQNGQMLNVMPAAGAIQQGERRQGSLAGRLRAVFSASLRAG
eukprot:TRINITY_DN31359_c0_g1_i1.p1 TRINITY_DN31359_c0_g1~~TRINITY_DN31359_c0_g1_i1.p1  ORF type:complete len:623 (-),score=84.01 TRINITY_DN31359_c0_g1_i1:86-1954(-)